MFHIAVASMKQSGRLYLPGFEVIEHLPAVFQHEALFLFGDIRNGNHNEFKHHPRICFISGPERGFSAEEEIFLQKNGIGVRLSPNILRAETAPIAAMSIMNYTMYNK
jgi:RsmE family RNA methyltransferase